MSLSRWIGIVPDPTAGGSTYEHWTPESSPPLIPVPTLFVPATSAQVDYGQTPNARTDEVRGKRGDTAPVSFLSAPKLTIDSRAYPYLLRRLIRNALGGTITAGTEHGPSPKPFEDTVAPLEEGVPPMLIAWLKREEQIDRLTGLCVSEIAMDFAIDKEGSFSATLDALYHNVGEVTGLKDPGGGTASTVSSADYSSAVNTFMLRDAHVFRGAEAGTEIPNLGGFSIAFNNGLIQDIRARFQPGHNIEKTTVGGVVHKLWLPARHKLGPQTVTGKFELSGMDVTQEQRRRILHAEKLRFTVAAGPLGTTPAAEEMMEITVGQMVATGGGAEPLVRQGDQYSSFDFTGYLDVSGSKDIECTFVGATALT
jgi:hypothetical protein